MTLAQCQPLLAQLSGWEVNVGGHLAKTYKLKNFERALSFVNRIGAIAEQEGHHPDIFLAWGRVGLEIWTHKIGGLSEADFVLAAKADRAFAGGA
jgi:4a-hydroxytetrahydrobiopterin dehydratase